MITKRSNEHPHPMNRQRLVAVAFIMACLACGKVELPADDKGGGETANDLKKPGAAEPVGCTDEALLVCVKQADGSYGRIGIGREGPDCAFKAPANKVDDALCSGSDVRDKSAAFTDTHGSCLSPATRSVYKVTAALRTYNVDFDVACGTTRHAVKLHAEDAATAAAAWAALYDALKPQTADAKAWGAVEDCPGPDVAISYGSIQKAFSCVDSGYAASAPKDFVAALLAFDAEKTAFAVVNDAALKAQVKTQWEAIKDLPECANAVSGNQTFLPTTTKPTGGCG